MQALFAAAVKHSLHLTVDNKLFFVYQYDFPLRCLIGLEVGSARRTFGCVLAPFIRNEMNEKWTVIVPWLGEILWFWNVQNWIVPAHNPGDRRHFDVVRAPSWLLLSGFFPATYR